MFKKLSALPILTFVLLSEPLQAIAQQVQPATPERAGGARLTSCYSVSAWTSPISGISTFTGSCWRSDCQGI